ncbi:TPA: hypothetical protein U0T06_003124 [Legionella pneumophila]|nr:hypothetical protein A9E85_15195 [Legionella pneumophila]HAT9351570.1 hypothetical protein [Legionella pneumophila subsp. pneumophila]HAU1016413.1 hypothetical protein [Legionella pneumophila]HAU1066239.1 hypothetical protein [Legionella pneumophila]HAU1159419.1 hypothetical protein [Legionella pneumophila]
MDIFTVVVSKKAKDNLRTVPVHIARKVGTWIDSVAHDGLLAVRKIPGFHDEPLKGDRKGQRSIRLSKAYRAIYVIGNSGNIEIAEIIEVHKHDY